MRQRYQQGSLQKQRRADGTVVWRLRYWATGAMGKRVQRQAIIGPVAMYPTELPAQRAADAVRLEIDKVSPVAAQQTTVAQLIEHYRRLELPDDDNDVRKSWATKNAYRSYLKNWIQPRWGQYKLAEVKTIAVEDWLRSIPGTDLANGSKSKIRNIKSTLFNHAIRHQWFPKETTPMRVVQQSAQRQQAPGVLKLGQIQALWSALFVREQAMVSCEYSSGLRVSEAFATNWEDCSFDRLTVLISRGFVKGHVGKLKTESSKKLMPLDPYVAQDLLAWRKVSPYAKDQDWVFASDVMKGTQPLWPQKVMVGYIRPAAKQAGIKMHIGWHTFRHSFPMLLSANGGDVKTVQELLRHASVKTTVNVYTQAIPDHLRAAQSKLVEMIRQSPVGVSRADITGT